MGKIEKTSKKNEHKFKKKKLNNMLNNPKHQECIKKLELLLSKKNDWVFDDLKIIFTFLCNDFEVASVYGYQLEKAFLSVCDNAHCYEIVQIDALCMSRFANYKRPNNMKLINVMLSSFVKLCIQLYDFFKVPSNLSDFKFSFVESQCIFPDMILKDDNDVQIILNRIEFVVSTIGYCFDTSCDSGFLVHFKDIMNMSLSLLSESTADLRTFSKESVFMIHIFIIRLLIRITDICEVKGCMINFIQNILAIVIDAITDKYDNNSDISKDYLRFLLSLILKIAIQDCPMCLSKMSTIVSPLLDYVLHSTDNFASMTVMDILCEILRYDLEINVNKCVKMCSTQLRQLKVFVSGKYVCQDSSYLATVDKLMEIVDGFTLEEPEEELESLDDDYADLEEPTNEELQEVEVLPDVVPMSDIEKTDADIESMETEVTSNDILSDTDVMATTEEVCQETIDNQINEVEMEDIAAKSISLEDMLKSFVPY